VLATSSFDKLQDGIKDHRLQQAGSAPTRVGVTLLESVAPFILRPVATSLLMAAIMLVGIVSVYAAADLCAAGGRLSDDPGPDVLSGRESRCDGDDGDGAAGAAVWRTAGLSQMTSTSSGGYIGDRAAVQPEPEYRYRRRGGAVGDQCGAELSAFEPAGAADLQQDQSRRCAGADAGDYVEDDASVAG
jgi:hypothetical protein